MHLELIESLELEVECDALPVSLAVDAVTIDLVQPTMGVSFEDSAWKSLPPGALRLRTHVETGPFTVDRVDVNEVPVYFQGGEAWLLTEGAGGFIVAFALPCGSETETIHAWVSFDADTPAEGPPSLGIYMPGSTTCGATESLALSSGSDPDDDLVSLRWEVDGVLLAEEVDEIVVNQAHDIRAILRDARGATTIASHSITCTPP